MSDNAAREMLQGAYNERPLHFGEGLVVALYRLLKGTSLYHRSNEVTVQQALECLNAVRDTLYAAGAEEAIVHIGEDTVFCNSKRVRITAESLTSIKGFIKMMRLHCVGRLVFTRDITVETLREFALAFNLLEDHNENNSHLLAEQLDRHHVIGLEVGEWGAAGTETPEALRRKSKEVYFSTIGAIKDLTTKSVTGHDLELRRVKRLMMSTVNLIMQEESSLLGLANIKSYDDYTFSHSVNVAVFSVGLGQRIGLPRVYLYHLGICGLFHDIGKQAVPHEILNKPGALSPEEWEVIRTHPTRGAEMALVQRNWGELLYHIMAATFEHHVKYDGSGYPALTEARKPSLFSRIITIADCYDALSRPRVYRKTPYLSEKILGMMMKQSGKDFDPILVKLFVNMVGVYPLGALLRLSTNQLALVTRIPDDPNLVDRPTVTILHRSTNGYDRGELLDLAAKDDEGSFKYHIMGTLDPNEFGISVEEFYI